MRLSSNGRRGVAAAVVALIIVAAAHIFTGSATATPPRTPAQTTNVVVHWCDVAPITDTAVRPPSVGNCNGKWVQTGIDGAKQELRDANDALTTLTARYAAAKKLASRVNRLNRPADYQKGLDQIEELQRLYREFRHEHNVLVEVLRGHGVDLGVTRLAPETLEMHLYGLN